MNATKDSASARKTAGLRTGTVFVVVCSDRQRLKLNCELTAGNISSLVMEANARNMPVDLSELNLTHLIGLRLNSMNLSHADLKETKFREADFTNADFTGAILVKAVFIKSNFTGAILKEANVRGADFSFSSFRGVSGLETAKSLNSAKFYSARDLSREDREIILRADPNILMHDRERLLHETISKRFGWS